MSGPKADAILAKTASQTKKKKRKLKSSSSAAQPSHSVGAMIVDEDTGWPQDTKDEEEDDLQEAVVASDRGFKKRKTTKGESSWVTVQEGVGGEGSGARKEDEGEEPTPADEQPTVVETSFVGGLVTAKELKKHLPQNKVPEKQEYTAEEIAQAQETVYRDASGKKIDTKLAKAEAARLKRERQEKELQKMEWGKGLVQREEAEKRRQEMEKNRSKAFARGIDDKDLNEELKAKELWNDPAAAFLTVRTIPILHPTRSHILCRRISRKVRRNQSMSDHLLHRIGSASSQGIDGTVSVRRFPCNHSDPH